MGTSFAMALLVAVVALNIYLANGDPREKRLSKELRALLKESPPGVHVNFDSAYENSSRWLVDIDGGAGTLYAGERFQLLFEFGPQYPYDAPEVMFVGPKIPLHYHVYSNGIICLSTLTQDWSPALDVRSICLSIISMLSEATHKARPPGDYEFVQRCSRYPKKAGWWYHTNYHH